ncbi:hypothetical protein HNV12_26685 [Methanococcoides sp. SA1]|nr:hypothetical protein [Methanococcoides sp. SA1]
MKRLAITLVLVFILAIMSSGCINELAPVTDNNATVEASDYELEVFHSPSDKSEDLNTTTFYLSRNGSTNVVYMVAETSMIEIVPMEDVFNTGGDILSNVVILAGRSENVSASAETFEMFASSSPKDLPVFNYTLEDDVIRGQKHFVMEFDENITGIVAFVLNNPKGQDFMYVPTHDSTVRFVLPVGYTTGNPFVGKVIPDTDDRYIDEQGREVLVWYDLHAKSGTFTNMAREYLKVEISEEDLPYRTVMIKFYSESAPRLLLIGTSILFGGVLIVLGNYLSARRKLRKTRDSIEGTFTEKKAKNGKGGNNN